MPVGQPTPPHRSNRTLTVAADRTLTGHLTNRLDVDLGECHLLYDRWVYRIASLPRGKKQSIGEDLQPRYTKTWLQRDGVYQPERTQTCPGSSR